MAVRLPRGSLRYQGGKTTIVLPDRASVSRKIGRKAKADRIERGLRANRAKSASKQGAK